MLIVFGGLPGTGKTTIARAIAEECGAAYVRIDTIEEALRSFGAASGDVGPYGYIVAYAVSEDNLRMGRDVVADSVNPLAVTRLAWRDVAARAATSCVEIEVVCSDSEEHRRRIESRGVPPTWRDVMQRPYEPWDTPHLRIDTAHLTVAEVMAKLRSVLQPVRAAR